MSMAKLTVGHQAQLQDGRLVTISFVGATAFSPGLWVVLELDDNTGKNDGTVNKIKYFDCPPGHGIFVRPTTLKVQPEHNNALLSPPPLPHGL